MITCYKCKKNLDIGKKIGFKECCSFCFSDLHVCKNCKHYKVGKPYDCNIPGIDPVIDKEKNNFCEEFEINENPNFEKKHQKKDIAKKLFKENIDDDKNSSN